MGLTAFVAFVDCADCAECAECVELIEFVEFVEFVENSNRNTSRDMYYVCKKCVCKKFGPVGTKIRPAAGVLQGEPEVLLVQR